MQPFKINIDYRKSGGVYAHDPNTDTMYLDMVNHYSSLPLGYNHPALSSLAFQREVLDVVGMKTAVGLYDSPEYIRFKEEFKAFAAPPGFNHVHFACTGSLAIEAAIKTAWVHVLARDKKRATPQKKAYTFPSPVFALTGSFHGINSFGNFLSTTDRGFKILAVEDESPFDVLQVCNKWSTDSIQIFNEEYILQNCAGILIEPVQCGNGDIYLDIELLKKARRICTKTGIPLIFDEIQTGFGTTGKLWYWQHLGIEPDIIVFGKKSQVSGIMVKDGFAAIFNEYDKLSVTFDGDLVDMIRCRYIMQAIERNNYLDNITKQGQLLKEELSKIEQLKNVRGIGGLIAFDLDSTEQRDDFCQRAFHNRLLCNPTAERSVRLRPNLTITQTEVMQVIWAIGNSVFK